MNTLTTLGAASIAVTVAFTVYVAVCDTGRHVGQSIKSSLFEAWTNVCIGFGVNWLANFAILPLIGAHFTGAQNFWLGCIYTAVSVVRSFVIRRWFNARLVALAHRIAGK